MNPFELGYYEYDGTHCGELYDWLVVNEVLKDSKQSLTGYCDCFHKHCCTLNLDDQKLRLGDRLYINDGVIELVRADAEPFICPTHNVEHSGVGPYLCITTGQLI